MSKIVTVSIKDIQPNPHRKVASYPYDEAKLATLMQSIEDVGLWEGVIARKVDGKWQLAFGHHRVEAARRAGLKKIKIVERDLDDASMLQFMARENLEDYNAYFLTMLESWDAGEAYFAAQPAKSTGKAGRPRSTGDIAKFLGWVTPSGKSKDVANACVAVSKLIKEGHMDRTDFVDVSVGAAYALAKATQQELDATDKMARAGWTDQPEERKDRVRKAAKKAAKKAAAGEVGATNVGYDMKAAVQEDPAEPERPLKNMDKAIADMVKGVCNVLYRDRLGEQLDELVDAVENPDVIWDERSLRHLSLVREALDELSARAKTYQAKLAPPSQVKPVTTPARKALAGRQASSKEAKQ